MLKLWLVFVYPVERKNLLDEAKYRFATMAATSEEACNKVLDEFRDCFANGGIEVSSIEAMEEESGVLFVSYN